MSYVHKFFGNKTIDLNIIILYYYKNAIK